MVTPHLGASTREAQDKAGDTIAEQVMLALAGEFVPFAVNVSAAEASESVRPYLPLVERLGQLFAELNEGAPSALDVEYQGALADYDTRILTLSALKGLFSGVLDEPVTFVNAPQIAKDRGVEVREVSTPLTTDYVNLITVRSEQHSIAGTLVGLRGEPRLVMIDDHKVYVPPARHMLIVRNDDRPGMIGLVGTVLGEAGVNIADMDVGQSPHGTALDAHRHTGRGAARRDQRIAGGPGHPLRALAERVALPLDRDRRGRTHVGRGLDLRPELLGGLVREEVQVSVAAHLEHLGACLHAGTGARADVVVDGDLHGRAPSGRVEFSAWRVASRRPLPPPRRSSSGPGSCAHSSPCPARGRCHSRAWP